MNFNDIDWGAMWLRESKRYSQRSMSEKEIWDKRANNYDRPDEDGTNKLKKDDYISLMLDRIQVRPEWTVLDIGSGPGILSIPLARKAKSVTALDISPVMLEKLRNKAEKAGIESIQCLNSSMQDAFSNRQVVPHDVVVASRSLMVEDLREVLQNIVSLAQQAAYLTLPVIHLPFDREVYRIVGREDKKHPSYVYAYNMLYQMGIRANVEILCSTVTTRYVSTDEAIESLQQRSDPFNEGELVKLREYFTQKFAESPVFTFEGKSKWALIWWRTEDQD
jgi:2-polyprenyl-3-methyl-5-hydroxy-6-metoxy-1,4-benzoquinol methylase